MKLFLIIIVLAFIVFAIAIYLAWRFTIKIDKNYSNYHEPSYHKYHEYYKYNKYHEDDHDEWWH